MQARVAKVSKMREGGDTSETQAFARSELSGTNATTFTNSTGTIARFISVGKRGVCVSHLQQAVDEHTVAKP